MDELRLPDHCDDTGQYLATLNRLSSVRARGSRIFYSHDPDFWASVPQGIPLD